MNKLKLPAGTLPLLIACFVLAASRHTGEASELAGFTIGAHWACGVFLFIHHCAKKYG